MDAINPQNYIAVIGDVVESRRAADREGLQERLRSGLRDVNVAFERQVASRFVLTVGDEFQGLLNTADEIDRILATLRVHGFPAELRFGLGVGPLDTALQEEALGMDGRCFHRARRAITRAAQRRSPVEVETNPPNAAFDIYGLLYGRMRRRWTLRQREVTDLSMSGMEGQDIAVYLSITPSAVSQHLRAAGIGPLREATELWVGEIDTAVEGLA